MSYNNILGPRRGPIQTQHASVTVSPRTAIPGRESSMKRNRAGGMTFVADDWDILRRFLILGTTQNTYYASAETESKEALELIDKLIATDPMRFATVLRDVSVSGAPLKQSHVLFALSRAVSAKTGDQRRDTDLRDPVTQGRMAAMQVAPEILRTLSQTFEFLEYCRRQRGAGTGLLNLLKKSLLNRSVSNVEYQILKYRSRNGWTPRDLLRYAHPKTSNAELDNLLAWTVKPSSDKGRLAVSSSARLAAFEELNSGVDISAIEAAQLIAEFKLSHEMVPNELKNSPAVWEALLQDMNVGALVRNLRKLTQVGLLTAGSSSLAKTRELLTDQAGLQRARLHPLRVMMARRAYVSGTDRRGNSFVPSSAVVDILDDALDLSFKAVKPLNKRLLVAIDDSGSMGQAVTSDGMTAREAACALGVWYKRTENECEILSYSEKAALVNVTKRVTVDSLNRAIPRTGNGTNGAAPFEWAIANKFDADVVIQITDNNSWYGVQHTVTALAKYRQLVKHPVFAVAAATAPGGVSMLDPQDPHSLNVVGFDATVPEAIAAVADEVFGEGLAKKEE